MDKIYLNEMDFYGNHGVFPEEAVLGQRFRVNVVMETDLRAAGRSDNLEKTINYADVYTLCKEIVEGKRFNLVEAVAENIADDILDRFESVERVHVKVIKPNPPINGIYDSVAVEITRGRHE
ncbi:7,8-dihydroneopterin aldolase [Siminovitchia terrae]|uniref:7,8-dihydroneopterin aldolase n=1 Tax=Siminovitchia terrae TaxID=1914933 RepID=A0A429X309_SIMTE|nr:dihydroneopterin aldolase [Siminovitchia terrae]RST57752.1 dihydroneopterin aldolase [Siminovitchia terrae]GIN93532.1 7,8-dihydroneopterin aldolase [Siminovitchia terrae]GIN99157.1 7,8-dihydroneopterin aldolase [Siminovitchia terrae]